MTLAADLAGLLMAARKRGDDPSSVLAQVAALPEVCDALARAEVSAAKAEALAAVSDLRAKRKSMSVRRACEIVASWNGLAPSTLRNAWIETALARVSEKSGHEVSRPIDCGDVPPTMDRGS